MILIYNLSGLIVGAAGVLAAGMVIGLTGRMSVALFVLGLIWVVFGRRKLDHSTGMKRPAPSVFFIPLWFLSIPVFLLAGLMMSVDGELAKPGPADPRYARFQQDETALDQSKISGDPKLASAAHDALMTVARDDDMRVFASTSDGRVLVLAKIPSLKKISKADRDRMVTVLTDSVEADSALKGPKLYLGIKGRLTYGVVSTPSGKEIGSVVLEAPLYSFYDPPPALPTPEPSAPASGAEPSASAPGAEPSAPAPGAEPSAPEGASKAETP